MLAGTSQDIEVEIVFPVSRDAVTQTEEPASIGSLPVVPGVAGGEGCSVSGGCARYGSVGFVGG